MQPLKICIGPTIRIGWEGWCLPYAGFLYGDQISLSRGIIEWIEWRQKYL